MDTKDKTNETVISVKNLQKFFPIKKGMLQKTVGFVKAVDDVSFDLKRGETLGLVGESGCGKTTMGRSILRLIEPTGGTVVYHKEGEQPISLTDLDDAAMRAVRKDIQIVFQDPYSSLDPRMIVRDIITEPLNINGIGTPRERLEKAKYLMELVGLASYQISRYPYQFSGGQRQRIGLARALSLDPKIIICDEPVSALDVSVQAQVLNMFQDLQKELGLTYLFIAHDLSVVEHISDRVMVMYLGKTVELASSDRLYDAPKHPYTETLLGSIPSRDPRAGKLRMLAKGEIPSPSNPPSGCYFHPRCPYAKDICKVEAPALREIPGEQADHLVACHRAEEISLKNYRGEEQVKPA